MSLRPIMLTAALVLFTLVPDASARILDAELGRWTRRDPMGYVNGMSVYTYVGNVTQSQTDPSGLAWLPCMNCPNQPQTTRPVPPCTIPSIYNVHSSCLGDPERIRWLCPALNDPHVQQLYGQLCQGIRCPEIRCEECDGRGYWNGTSIVLCLTPQGLFSNPTNVRGTLLHELLHGLQEVWWGKIKNCQDRVCREVQAYAHEGQCRGQPNATAQTRCLCEKACASAINDSNCYWRTKIEWAPTPAQVRIVEDPEARMAACISDCMSFGSSCATGMNPFAQ